MKEININIEGYNVNGICVGCLNYNRKMFYSEEVKDCFKILANIDVPDGLTIQVCWECMASVRALGQFQTQILKSYQVLIDYSRQSPFLNAPEDLTVHATQRLNPSAVSVWCSTPGDTAGQDGLEVEVPPAGLKTELVQVKEEVSDDDFPSQTDEPDYEPLATNHTNTLDSPMSKYESSDEDIQLSELRKGKEKRKAKKSKKEGSRKKKVKEVSKKSKEEVKSAKGETKTLRKMKNLSEDLVQLFTMTEDQMWEIRAADLESKDFVKVKYKCNDCIIVFNSEKYMQDHFKGKHNPKSPTSYQCDVCKSYLLTTDNASVHRSLHLKAYSCKMCQYTTTMKRAMSSHTRLHKSETQKYECAMCNKAFATKSKLTYHKNVCKQEKPQCDCCGKVFANKVTLKYHLNVMAGVKSSNKPKEKLSIPCKGCGKVFPSKKSYRAHVVIHDGLEYPCPKCGKLFQWKRNLARHLRNHSDRETGARHECQQCGKRFSSRDCYNNHMRFSKKHVSQDSYVHNCGFCGKKFPTKWCLVDHVDWEHLKKIKYQCSVCAKPFKTAKIMVAHVNNIHGGRKQREPDGEHLCDICGKYYKTEKRLKGHVWAMHTHRSTTKSYKCALCPATFTWQTSVYKHVKCMHQNPKRQPPRPSQPKVELQPQQYYTVQTATTPATLSHAPHALHVYSVPGR
ncbi:zinc finger imprinted 3 [Plutella xylostella]|uniref:zinc finger imprinted 3 n=1 Tax=Plutella xylostella TaxID=51655 RepID=UPI0020325F94|nr:zinc finger imprinted 3 [Plutella xylostella]